MRASGSRWLAYQLFNTDEDIVNYVIKKLTLHNNLDESSLDKCRMRYREVIDELADSIACIPENRRDIKRTFKYFVIDILKAMYTVLVHDDISLDCTPESRRDAFRYIACDFVDKPNGVTEEAAIMFVLANGLDRDRCHNVKVMYWPTQDACRAGWPELVTLVDDTNEYSNNPSNYTYTLINRKAKEEFSIVGELTESQFKDAFAMMTGQL